MNKNILKEIDKLKYLTKFDRGKTLSENRILLTESILPVLKRIFLPNVAGLLPDFAMKAAKNMNLKNINTYVKEAFTESFNKAIIAAEKMHSFPAFAKGIGKSAEIPINNMLSMLQRLLRDGSSKALNTFERNVLHSGLAAVDDDFFKMLQKNLKELDDVKLLLDPKLSNKVKKDILTNPSASLKGISDDILKKMGIDTAVIRKTTGEVIVDVGEKWWIGLTKGSKKAIAIIGPKVKSILKNALVRFKNLSKRISLKDSWKVLPDAIVTTTMIPLWTKLTLFRIITYRIIGSGIGRFFRKMMAGKGKELAKKGAGPAGIKGEFWNRGLFSDLITVVEKEGVEKGGNKIIHFPSWLSTVLVGSRSFNYGVTALIWLTFILSDNIIGRYLKMGYNFLVGVMDGEVLGPCAMAAFSPIIANTFVPEDNTGGLNKLGITYDMKLITGDAYELYAALTPECFTSEEDFEDADNVLKEFIKNAPSRLYISLVAREYKKLTGKASGQVLPNFKELCRPGFGMKKGILYDDIVSYEKHEDWISNFIGWSMPMKRLPLTDYMNNVCKLPFIEKEFDDILRETNEYLYGGEGADVPQFIKEITDNMDTKDLETATANILNNPAMWEEINSQFKKITDKLELKGFVYNGQTGDLSVKMQDAMRLQVALKSSAGLDQLVYIDASGYFVDSSVLFGGNRDKWVGVEPQEMTVNVYPEIGDNLEYAIGSVEPYIKGVANPDALKQNTLCNPSLAETGYLCYLRQFQSGEVDYRPYLPTEELTDSTGISMSLQKRVPFDNWNAVAQQNPILWEIAAYIKHNRIAQDKRYRNYRPYKVFPTFVKVGRVKEGYLNKEGLGILLDR